MPCRNHPYRAMPPFGLTVYKSHKGSVLSFDKSKFMTTHPVAIDFYNWIQDMRVADESFYPTLLVITKIEQVDGEWRVTQNSEEKRTKHLCSRTSFWELNGYKCYGKHIMNICNVAVPDPRYLREEGCFISNKFNLQVDAFSCALSAERTS